MEDVTSTLLLKRVAFQFPRYYAYMLATAYLFFAIAAAYILRIQKRVNFCVSNTNLCSDIHYETRMELKYLRVSVQALIWVCYG